MTKITQLVLGIIVVSLLMVITIGVYKSQNNLGNIFVNENAYSSAPTYATSTLTNNVATSLIARATSSRTYAKVCNYSAANDIVWIYKQATSTGVVINRGTPIFASSSTQYPQHSACYTADINDPYMGQIWGIVNSTTTLTIEYLQN